MAHYERVVVSKIHICVHENINALVFGSVKLAKRLVRYVFVVDSDRVLRTGKFD